MGAAGRYSARLVEAETNREMGGEELTHAVVDAAAAFEGLRGNVVVCVMSQTIECVISYLGLLEAGATVLPVTRQPDNSLLQLARQWQSPICVDGSMMRATGIAAVEGHALETRLLLPTSGSTSAPKMARLSGDNLLANCKQIVAGLGLRSDEAVLAHLPLVYSYGLSILHTHLEVGSTIVLSSASPVSTAFWQVIKDHRITSLPGVPKHYEMYLRVIRDPHALPIDRFTQAGGRLSPALQERMVHLLRGTGAQLWVMYGQTEATARISIRHPHDAGDFTSVGRPVVGTELSFADDGEVLVSGPQVMLGYATAPDQLNLPAQHPQVLKTGDLGHLDSSGQIVITGRKSRMTKALGVRMNLDELEASLAPLGVLAALGDDERLVLVTGAGRKVDRQAVARELNAPSSLLRWLEVDDVPMTVSGKVDYRLLGEWIR